MKPLSAVLALCLLGSSLALADSEGPADEKSRDGKVFSLFSVGTVKIARSRYIFYA